MIIINTVNDIYPLNLIKHFNVKTGVCTKPDKKNNRVFHHIISLFSAVNFLRFSTTNITCSTHHNIK